METVEVFVWRVRLCLIAIALGLAGTGGDPLSPLPGSSTGQELSMRPAAVVATLSAHAGPQAASITPAFAAAATRPAMARDEVAAPQALQAPCAAQLRTARGSARASASDGKMRDCRAFSVGGGTNAKSLKALKSSHFVRPSRLAASGGHRIKGAAPAKAGQKVARKSDARPRGKATAMTGPGSQAT